MSGCCRGFPRLPRQPALKKQLGRVRRGLGVEVKNQNAVDEVARLALKIAFKSIEDISIQNHTIIGYFTRLRHPALIKSISSLLLLLSTSQHTDRTGTSLNKSKLQCESLITKIGLTPYKNKIRDINHRPKIQYLTKTKINYCLLLYPSKS